MARTVGMNARIAAPPPRTLLPAALACALLLASHHPASAAGGAPIRAAIAEFDNHDTSGELPERAAAHADLVAGFSGLLRERLGREPEFQVVALACPAEPCTAGTVAPDELIAAAREAGARILVYGGVHKMSTLVQMGKFQAVDLEKETLLVDRSFSFRGDNAEAFRRAADFLARYLEEAAPSL